VTSAAAIVANGFDGVVFVVSWSEVRALVELEGKLPLGKDIGTLASGG
jgi:hypothetical protein